MNDADISLIISLANDELNGQDRLAALERVSASPEMARELAVQIEMKDAVQGMPDVTAMTETERTALRSDLIEELHLESAPVVALPKKRKIPWWQPVFGLASAAALVVAIVVVPGMFSSSSSDDAVFTEASSNLDADSSNSTAESDTERFAPDESGSTGLDASPDAAESDDTSSITEVATTAAPSAASPPLLFQVPDMREEEFSDIAIKGASVATLRETLIDSGFATGESSLDGEALSACIEDLTSAGPGGEFVPLGSSDRETVYVGVDTGTGVDEILEIDIANCTVVATFP